ncbi:MAG: response regulator transcription factor [Bacteroidaceae bacterium]|nr:response regulator transcription factor [Bacteroidaceae bacterium]MBP9637429.1 response regulator transcription factor [Bacteroidaceae bacterium]
MKRILVVDDEESLCEILQFNLQVEGYEVEVAYSAEKALTMNLISFDLLILDVMMEGMNGFRLAQKLKSKAETAQIPIIFCTAMGNENDIVTGLNIGADDYISKPFSMREVAARVKSVLRRAEAKKAAQIAKEEESAKEDAVLPLVYEDLSLDLIRKVCTVKDEDIALTKKEFEILTLLLSKPGRVFSRAEILDRVWSEDVIVVDRTIDVNITRLRKKIGIYGSCIVTRQGYGYTFQY